MAKRICYADGSTGINVYSAANSAGTLLTSLTTDQAARLDSILLDISPVKFLPNACTAALAGVGAGNVDNGNHHYRVTFVRTAGESELGDQSNIVTVTDKTVNGQINLTNLPLATMGEATSRKIYRTKAGGTIFYLLTTINDNITTTYLDNIADTALGASKSIIITHAFGTIFPGVVHLESAIFEVLLSSGSGWDEVHLIYSDGTATTWSTSTHSWVYTTASGTTNRLTWSNAPIRTTGIFARFYRNGTYIDDSIFDLYDFHLFGRYESPDYEFYYADELTIIEEDYFVFGNIGTNSISTNRTFKLKNNLSSSATYTLTPYDIKYPAEVNYESLFTLSTNTGTNKVDTLTIAVAAGAFSPLIYWYYDASVAQMAALANEFHYAKLQPEYS